MSYIHSEKDSGVGLFQSDDIICVDYCRDSGLLPCDECRLDPRLNRIKTGYFVRGTEPTDHCNIHKEVYIDSQTGYIADDTTSYLSRRKIALLNLIRGREYDDIEIKDRRYTIKSRTSN